MLTNSWESLGQVGDQTSQSQRKSTLNIHCKDWCWSWGSNTLAPWCREPAHWCKDPDAGKDWGQEEKGVTEEEMVGWHHRLNGNEFEQALEDGEGQGILACCSPWVTKSRTQLSDWTTTTNTEKKKWNEKPSISLWNNLNTKHSIAA